VDVVVLHHLLEFEPHPHQVLREVNRVLIGEGHAVIIGFNPWSLWGLWRHALAWRHQPPWCGCFFSQRRVKDWLRLLGFDIVHARHFYFRPPVKGPFFTTLFSFWEKTGAYRWPYCGGAYIVVAKKRLVCLTPIWAATASARIIPDEVVEPCPMVDR
jgi:SAM-dependent methyltransferase